MNHIYFKKLLQGTGIQKNLYLNSFIILAFCLPFFDKIVPYIIIFVCIPAFLAGLRFRSGSKTFRNPIILIIILLFYLVHFAGIFYSHNKSVALFDLEVKLSLFIFPVILSFSDKYVTENYNKVLFSFVLGNLLSSTICLVQALIRSIVYKADYFFYMSLSIFHHPAYSAMYLSFSIVILFYLLKYKAFNLSKKITIVLYSLIIFFSVLIFLLSSKSGILVSFLVLLIIFSIEIFRYKRYVPAFFWLLIVVIFFSSALKYNSRFNIVSTLTKKENDMQTAESTEVRMHIWETSIAIVKRHMLFGVGPGDIKDSLMNSYQKRNMTGAIERRLNVHNQYLETFLGEGVIGFVLLLSLFILPLILKIHRNNYILLFFLIISGLNFFTESMLNTQAGVVFFALFYSILNFKIYASSHSLRDEKMA